MAGKMKTAEKLLLCGPYGKYLLEGCFHPSVQKVVFEYLDLLGSLWEKTISLERLMELERRMPVVLAELATVLPAWEMDMNRHQMLHLVQAIRSNGPCWVWAMFGFERFWKHLTDWMSQTSHPEATMFNAHYAFKAACLALTHVEAEQLLADDGREGQSAQSPFQGLYHHLHTFDRDTNELILPSFLQAHQGADIEMRDSQGGHRFGHSQRPDPNAWQAELHLFYLQFPELCQVCECCPKYEELWSSFVQAEVSGNVTKQRLPSLLHDWFRWGSQQPQFCQHAQALCSGPRLSVEVYDRAVIQGVEFSSMQTEGKKRSHDSVVLMKDSGVYWAGRVRYFLSHTPPGMTHVHGDSMADIAHVSWYGHVPAREASVCPTLGCPIFKKCFKDDPKGNMWPMEKLTPCKLAAVSHCKKKDRLVILSRFASFLQQVPRG